MVMHSDRRPKDHFMLASRGCCLIPAYVPPTYGMLRPGADDRDMKYSRSRQGCSVCNAMGLVYTVLQILLWHVKYSYVDGPALPPVSRYAIYTEGKIPVPNQSSCGSHLN